MKYRIIVLLLLVFSSTVFAQSIKDYKFVLVPDQFGFQKAVNEYGVNELSKFLFTKYGIKAMGEAEAISSSASQNSCDFLKMKVEEGGLLSTYVIFSLINCKGTPVYTSPKGKSKSKNFKEAYNEAFRDAFKGLEQEGFTYSDEILSTPQKPVDIVAEVEAPVVSQPEVQMPKKEVIAETIDNSIPEGAVVSEVEEAPTTIPMQTSTTDIAVVKKDNPSVLTSKAKSFTSADGAYSLKIAQDSVLFYEGETLIGKGIKTSRDSYYVSTSEFSGIGFLNDSLFIVEREIKGVAGLVKMVFHPVQ